MMTILNEVLSILLLLSPSAPKMTLSTTVKHPDCSDIISPQSVGRILGYLYGGADKSLARPGRKQATGTENFDFNISYL
jgi:hypothetical protein